jgi:hypothetical protein
VRARTPASVARLTRALLNLRSLRSDGGGAAAAAAELRAAHGGGAPPLVALELGAGCNGLPGAPLLRTHAPLPWREAHELLAPRATAVDAPAPALRTPARAQAWWRRTPAASSGCSSRTGAPPALAPLLARARTHTCRNPVF